MSPRAKRLLSFTMAVLTPFFASQGGSEEGISARRGCGGSKMSSSRAEATCDTRKWQAALVGHSDLFGAIVARRVSRQQAIFSSLPPPDQKQGAVFDQTPVQTLLRQGGRDRSHEE